MSDVDNGPRGSSSGSGGSRGSRGSGGDAAAGLSASRRSSDSGGGSPSASGSRSASASRSSSDDDRSARVVARASWSRLAEPGDEVAAALVRELGHERALDALRTRRESALERFRPRLENLCVQRDLDNAARVGARVVIPGDDDWPRGLDDLPSPPHCLWVRGSGELRALCDHSLAVVGARAATGYGERLAASLSAGVASRGVTVVSGAAYGIDAAAHRGALAADGPTIAVLACGVERAYPSGHRDLLDAIAANGLVVSELPPGSAPMRQRFLQRNRLIATMTGATLVVEAGLRSGSRNTAATAGKHLRIVMATPGPVTSPASAGCHDMIREQLAVLVTDLDEVMELIGRVGGDAAPGRPRPRRPGDDLEPDDRRVHDGLGLRARSVEEVAAIAGVSLGQVQACLGRLSLRGYVRRVEGGWVRS